jgi:nucleotide-binding universal stress UspA family protein
VSRWKEVQKVLVPVDFSPSSKEVVEVGADIARDRGVPLVLLHVVPVPGAPFDPAYGVAAEPRLLAELQDASRRQVEGMAAALTGVAATGKVRVGPAAREIVLEAKESGAGVVVLGTHGRTGLRHVFLGSVAESVVRLCPCPVLTVRHRGFEIEKL